MENYGSVPRRQPALNLVRTLFAPSGRSPSLSAPNIPMAAPRVLQFKVYREIESGSPDRRRSRCRGLGKVSVRLVEFVLLGFDQNQRGRRLFRENVKRLSLNYTELRLLNYVCLSGTFPRPLPIPAATRFSCGKTTWNVGS